MPKETFFNLPEEKRQKIVDIAIEEFAENDYLNASVSNIVSRASIAKGSFYQYFDDKRDLYIYLFELAAQEKARFLQGAKPPDPQMDVFAFLRWLLQMGVHFELSNPGLSKIGYRAFFGDTPVADDVIETANALSTQFFGDLVRQGIEQGNVDPEVDADLAAFVFTAVFTELGGYLFKRLNIEPTQLESDGLEAFATPEIEKIFNGVIEILERGLGLRDKA